MKLSYLFALCIFFACHFSVAEVFTWVDKDGKKHFGDQIPPEYRKQAKEIAPQSTNRMESTSSAKAPSAAAHSQAQLPPKELVHENNVEPEALDCTQQWQRFKRAELCFSDCTLVGGGVNAGKCSHCEDVKKPSCELK